MVVRELFVCSVDSTRCPVIDARIAIFAVSLSRISPIRMMLGSCLRIERSTVAKSNPISEFTCTWLSPSILISTGSSTVMMFVSSLFSF